MAVTRAAWIREKVVIPSWASGEFSCGSVVYDVTRTPRWNYSFLIYNLVSGETRVLFAALECGKDQGGVVLGGHDLEVSFLLLVGHQFW